MVNVALPAILSALVSQAQSAFGDGTVVVDGPPTEAPEYGITYVYVGADGDPNSGEAMAATLSQSWASQTGPSRDESGTIRFAVECLTGDSGDIGMGNARDAVFEAAEVVAGLVRTGSGLGVASIVWSSAIADATYEQAQTDQGAWAVLRFGIEYRARI